MIIKLKKLIAKNFKGFAFYYSYLNYRVFLAVFISIAVGILDGFGLTMFLPLLEMVGDSEGGAGDNIGNLQFIIDFFSSIGIEITLISVLMIMIGFFLFKGLAMFINGAYRARLSQVFISKIRKNLLYSFIGLRFKYFVTADVGRIQNTMSGEVERVSRSFHSYFRSVEQAVLVVVYMSFAFVVNAQFAVIVSLGGILTNFLYKSIYKRTKGRSTEFTTDSHLYQGQIIQLVGNFKYLRATALIDKFSSQLNKSIDLIETSRKKIQIYSAILTAAREPILIIVVALAIIIQVKLFNTALAPIVLSLLFFYRALTALLNVQTSWNYYLEASGSVDNLIDFQNEIKRNQEEFGGQKTHTLLNGLELKHACFSYGDKSILKDINLSIAKNETIAFVGESGSGKTTLVNILAGLMPLDQGEMYVDNYKSTDLNMKSYQARIGYITQEPVIFNDTIYNNVTAWDKFSEQNYHRFKQALKQAAIWEYVASLPKGHEAMLGSNGVNLSGGQKQRISIARELYKEIDILIMDEATSALDTETENSIQQSIDLLKGSYTIIIVAHRLSTIKDADRIVMMKEGTIERIGSFEELINSDTNFKRMVELQGL